MAVALTCAALLAIAATVRPASDGHAAVTIEGPISSFPHALPVAAKAQGIVIPVSATETAPVTAPATAH